MTHSQNLHEDACGQRWSIDCPFCNATLEGTCREVSSWIRPMSDLSCSNLWWGTRGRSLREWCPGYKYRIPSGSECFGVSTSSDLLQSACNLNLDVCIGCVLNRCIPEPLCLEFSRPFHLEHQAERSHIRAGMVLKGEAHPQSQVRKARCSRSAWIYVASQLSAFCRWQGQSSLQRWTVDQTPLLYCFDDPVPFDL